MSLVRIRSIFHHPWRSWLLTGGLLLVLSAIALGYSARTIPPRAMLAQVHRGLDFETPPAYVGNDPELNPETLAALAGISSRDPFVVQWDGYFVIEEGGVYRLRIRSDDGVGVWVGDRLVADRMTAGGEQYLIEPVALDRGLHTLRIRYVQRGERTLFRLAWATPQWREEYQPAYVVVRVDPEPSSRAVMLAVDLPGIVALAWSLWLLAALALGLTQIVSRVAGEVLWKALRWQDVAPFALIGLALLLFTLDDGTAPWRAWVPDELNPKLIHDAVEMRLAGGWFHLYPAFHVTLIAAITSPIFALVEWGWASFEDPAITTMIHVLARMVSTIMGILLLVAVALLANFALERRRTVAPYVLLGTPAFVFYGQTANVDVPYVFWCTLAALAFVRALSERTTATHVWLGVLVAAAATTKDQAYGFFPGVAVLLLWSAWRQTPHDRSARQRLWLTLTDRRIWSGLGAFLVAYALLLGVLINPTGVRDHFVLLTTGSAPFRMFPPTASGHLDLLATTLRLAWLTIGPLASLAAIAGLATAVARPDRYRNLLPLLIMPISYQITLIGVVGYVYDRFLLGYIVVAAILAAAGIHAGLDRLGSARLRTAAATIAIALLLYPGFALSARLATDTRTQVERWLAAHNEGEPFMVGLGMRIYLPNLYPFRHHVEQSSSLVAALAGKPELLIVNEDWVERREEAPHRWLTTELGAAGYEEVFFTQGWPENPGWRVLLNGTLGIDPVLSNIRKASPPLSVWRKVKS
jgi:hypothetical protein